ncbi:MAG: alcohol dehydrogenase catalytic domain-containing protein [Spirochaetaceae bacterium]|jgi:L-iditol 2-dehydrogenase|nr:alcohol dehydrogenase catalytic domain-containing protein [Spirochaetaceae bacterium]
MKQVRITAPYTFQVEDAPIPEISGDQALVKINALGICGSDFQIYHGKHQFMTFPVILGHEAAVTVEKVGKDVTGFAPGDTAVVEPQVFCGECVPCTQGRFNVCEKLKVLGVHLDGFSCEYAAVEARYLHKTPKTMNDALAALTEPFAVGVAAARRSPRLSGALAAVVGAGTIGNFTAQAAKALGAKKTLIADINQAKLDYALQCGVDEAVNVRNRSLKDAILEHFGSGRADIIIDCAANPFTFKSILEAARPNSDIVITGNFKEPVTFNLPIIQRQEIALLGHMMYVREDFQTAIKLLSQGGINTEKTVTKTFDFADYQEAYRYGDANPDSIMKLMIRF